MPWTEVSTVTLRKEFVALAMQPGANISDLCHRFGISRKTGYKWISRFRQLKGEDFQDRSKRPQISPGKTDHHIEALIIQLREKHPEWGGRKLKRRLEDLGHHGIPSPSTITEILRRNDLLHTTSSQHHPQWQRFEHKRPNDLWQMDFKGPIQTHRSVGHALTILDDCSRYSLGIRICSSQTFQPTYLALREVFRRYGVPWRMTMDNGNPWGNPHGRWTKFAAWLIDQGIAVSYSRPHHPQTQGKDERFHRTLKGELLSRVDFKNRKHCQYCCEQWRSTYNHDRPHDALKLSVPGNHYYPSTRQYQEHVREYDYAPDDAVRSVSLVGQVSFKGRSYKISEAFAKKRIAIRPTSRDGVMAVYYRHQKVGVIDLTKENV